MSNHTQKLPSMEDFKKQAKVLKISNKFQKLGHAQNALAQKFGFKDFNAIKTKLVERDLLFNKLPNKIKTYKLSTGAIVNSQGLYKTKDGYSTSAESNNAYTPKKEVEKALHFIDNVMEKRKTINLRGSTSYGLKHHAEAYIKHYNLFLEDSYYISNAAFIIALDIRNFEIKELCDEYGRYSLNIQTNYKSFKGNFYDKLRHGDFDYTRKANNGLSIFSNVKQLEKNGFKNIKKIRSIYFNILQDRFTIKDFSEHFSVQIFHLIKASRTMKGNKFFVEIFRWELLDKFSYENSDISDFIKNLNKDLNLSNELLTMSFYITYDDIYDYFIIYWENKEIIPLPTSPIIDKEFLRKNIFFHSFKPTGKIEYQGIIENINNLTIQVKYFSWISGDLLEDLHNISFDSLDNFIFYQTDKEMREVNHLVADNSNIDSHKFFSNDKKGYKKAKIINKDNKELSNFILKNIYGYKLETL